jgi:hypothetical protein
MMPPRPRAASRSRYALDPAVIAAGKLPDSAPVVTSAANPHYQKRFDELHKLAAAGDWAAVRERLMRQFLSSEIAAKENKWQRGNATSLAERGLR